MSQAGHEINLDHLIEEHPEYTLIDIAKMALALRMRPAVWLDQRAEQGAADSVEAAPRVQH
mgnify:CR=1 FL=1